MAPVAPTKRKSLRLKATERLANPLAPRKVHRPESAVTDTFLSTKADKHRIRHSSFVSRITKPSTAAGAGAAGGTARARPATSHSSSSIKNAKRHARKRDLQHSATTISALDSLADALPTLTTEEIRAGEAERDGRIRHKSLRSRPGALKKKERIVRGEMERFGLSLAQLVSVKENDEQQAGLAAVATANRTDSAPISTTRGKAAAAPAAAAAAAGVVDGGDTMMDGVEVEAKPAPSGAANRFAALRGFIAATMEQNPAFMQRPGAAGKGT